MKKEPVYLRALEKTDLDRTYAWHNDQELYESLGRRFRHVSRQAEEAWLNARVEFSNTELSLAICLADNDEHIGNIYLRNIDWIARHGEMNIFIGDSSRRGQGLGCSALNQLAVHAFNNLGLNRIYLYVLKDNVSAQKAYKKCGFNIEGVLVQHGLLAGEFVDMLVMGLCKSDKA